ncbi:MAG: metallophosphoesterase [Bacteroidales bacterium]|nr:metallophosphoesterase [Bacteroidales bacterium]
MKNFSSIKKSLVIFGLIWFFISCNSGNVTTQSEDNESFTFVFMTDIHLQPERNAVEGFRQAIDSVNKFNPDFIITGGDLVMDVLGQNYQRADLLYNLYEKTVKSFNMPVYNTMGNHEVFGIYEKSGVEKNHPEYGEKMYENRIGKRYYSFDHKGWHFLILDSVEDTDESSYIGKVDDEQMEWIKSDLEKSNHSTPIVVSVHIPFITSYMQIFYGSLEPNSESLVITNSKEVLELFKDYNLKLVLQGHLHFLEDIYVQGTHFITAGAVCARWWKGTGHGMEEGFLVVNINGDDFNWEYFDYGWEAEEE